MIEFYGKLSPRRPGQVGHFSLTPPVPSSSAKPTHDYTFITLKLHVSFKNVWAPRDLHQLGLNSMESVPYSWKKVGHSCHEVHVREVWVK